MGEWWEYDELQSGEPYDWGGAARGDKPWDNIDFHLDIGCGRSKKGRIGIDRFADPGVDIVMDLETLKVDFAATDPEKAKWLRPIDGKLPFPSDSIQSIISHHCLEHIDQGFVRLMDECHRVLMPGCVFRIIVPLFPSAAAVADPDHKRYFMDGVDRDPDDLHVIRLAHIRGDHDERLHANRVSLARICLPGMSSMRLFAPSQAGFDLVGGSAPAPQTTDQLQAQWLGSLPQAPRVILSYLLDKYPGSVSREDIAQSTTYSATSSTFANALSTLRTNGLIEDMPGKQIRASETLFA